MKKIKLKKYKLESICKFKCYKHNGDKRNLEEKLLIQLNKLNYTLNKNKVLDLVELAGNSKRYLVRNFMSGILKGIGIGIGFSIITAIIIYLMQKIIKLNIPVISRYISDIVEIVERTK